MIPNGNGLLGASQSLLFSHFSLSPPLSLPPSLSPPLSHTHAPPLSLYLSHISLIYTYIRPYIYQTGRQPLGLSLCICFTWKGHSAAGRASAAVEFVGGMTGWSNGPIALILLYYEGKTHTRGHTGKHTTVDRLASTE